MAVNDWNRILPLPISHPRSIPRQGNGAAQQNSPTGSTASPFETTLKSAMDKAVVRLSSHAESRLQSRGIVFDQDLRQSVSHAIDQLSAKGAKESLIVAKQAMFVVNVPNRTIITAVDHAGSNDQVFTNIDSAIVLDRTYRR